jgi:hypothetical protein
VTHFNPSGVSVVNLPTWLWIDAEAWHSQTVSATAGTVSVTAVATPRSVSWSMGDGTVVTCKGPGIAYDTTKSSQAQVTDCEHTYTTTSAGQPTTDGKDNGNAFTVTATVAWSVAWTVTGALGGGELPDLDTSTSSTLRVEQVESINELASFRRPETVDLGRRP